MEPNVRSYTEKKTGLSFISDQTFVDTGERKIILEKYKHEYQRQYSSLQSFPQGNRNCYKVKVAEAGAKYLIRAGFLYGDYDEQDMQPTFDLYVGNDMWDSVKITDSSNIVNKEIIHIPPQSHVLVCLVNTGHGIPFISTLEFRPLDNSTYLTPGSPWHWPAGGTLVLPTDAGEHNHCKFSRLLSKWIDFRNIPPIMGLFVKILIRTRRTKQDLI